MGKVRTCPSSCRGSGSWPNGSWSSRKQGRRLMPKQEPEPLTISQLMKLPDSYLLKPDEVAALFRVDPKTVSRWAKAGKLATKRTLGGHRRYPVGAVLAKLQDEL